MNRASDCKCWDEAKRFFCWTRTSLGCCLNELHPYTSKRFIDTIGSYLVFLYRFVRLNKTLFPGLLISIRSIEVICTHDINTSFQIVTKFEKHEWFSNPDGTLTLCIHVLFILTIFDNDGVKLLPVRSANGLEATNCWGVQHSFLFVWKLLSSIGYSAIGGLKPFVDAEKAIIFRNLCPLFPPFSWFSSLTSSIKFTRPPSPILLQAARSSNFIAIWVSPTFWFQTSDSVRSLESGTSLVDLTALNSTIFIHCSELPTTHICLFIGTWPEHKIWMSTGLLCKKAHPWKLAFLPRSSNSSAWTAYESSLLVLHANGPDQLHPAPIQQYEVILSILLFPYLSFENLQSVSCRNP